MSIIEKVENNRNRVLTVEDAADMMIVSDSSIYRDIKFGALNAVKFGDRRYIIVRDDLAAYLKDMQINFHFRNNRDEIYKTEIFKRIYGYTYYPGAMITAFSVAKSLKVSVKHLRNIIAESGLYGERIRNSFRISMQSLAYYLNKNQTDFTSIQELQEPKKIENSKNLSISLF